MILFHPEKVFMINVPMPSMQEIIILNLDHEVPATINNIETKLLVRESL